jgi:MtrB/PioB family decaheme-associated outer membrane protein
MTMNTNASMAFSLKTTAAAVLAVLGTAWAAEADDLVRLAKPESTVSFGLGYLDSDASRFGQYSGMNERGVYGLLDLDIINRDDATGTWLKFRGRNLGLESRELRFEHNRQGNWGYSIEYGTTPRFEPYDIRTAVTGIGSSNLRVPAVSTPGTNVDLKTKREALGLGFDKILAGNFSLQVRFKTEDKDGARLFARGTTGGAGRFQFTPEPINSTTRQLEAIVGYAGKQLQLSGGYYGTMYNNHYTGLIVTEVGGATGLAGFTPIGLPPDNHSHQFYLNGGYSFTPTTRGTFRVSYSQLKQDDAFVAGVPLAPGIGSNLGGKIETTFAQVGITARPMPKLSLLANLRHEDRDDQTPVRTYFTPASGTTNGQNEPRSHRTTAGKAEASYSLPMGFRVTGGLDYDERNRNSNPVRSVSYREKTEETAWRVEVRRSMSETVNGAISYVRSDRDGSSFLNNVLANGTAGSNLIAPLHLADRERDKWRLSLDWTPVDALSLQFFFDDARDTYGARTAQNLGPRSGKAQNYSLDAAFTVSEALKFTAWYSRNDNRADQATCASASSAGVCPASAGSPLWTAQLRNLGESFGMGVHSKPMARLQLGADLVVSDITDEFHQQAITAGATVNSLPNIKTRNTSLKLFADYAIQKNTGIRLNYVYDRWSSNDWTWTTFSYSDGTRLSQESPQKVHFIGVSGYYRWQ